MQGTFFSSLLEASTRVPATGSRRRRAFGCPRRRHRGQQKKKGLKKKKLDFSFETPDTNFLVTTGRPAGKAD